MTTTRSIDTAELRDRLDDPSLTIVDVRPLAAYNGWRLGGEARGGHIPGAVAFPVAWLRQRRRGRDRAAPRREGHHRRSRRSWSTATAPRTHRRLARAPGRASASTACSRLRGGVRGLGRRSRAAARAAAELRRSSSTSTGSRDVLAGERPRRRPTGEFLLFHVNFGVPEEYAEGHIPGALYLDTNWLEDPADWNRRSPEELEAALRALGITQRHDGRPLRPRHRGRRQREVAGPPGRPDRRDARGC